jgi:hypothetical protein
MKYRADEICEMLGIAVLIPQSLQLQAQITLESLG